MKRRIFIRRDEEGVSPVIATILMVAITVVLAAVLYIMVMYMVPPEDVEPRGTWGPRRVLSATAVNVEFGMVTPEQKPMNLEIILLLNDSIEGKYSFSSNDDGALAFSGGTDFCDISYVDLADNQKVSVGDMIQITNLYPGSSYTLMMIWGQSGGLIASTTFSTGGS